jgi:hypothetical protein
MVSREYHHQIGTQWLREWNVDIPSAFPVILQSLIMRDWKTGDVEAEYSLRDYEETWGNVRILLDAINSSPCC